MVKSTRSTRSRKIAKPKKPYTDFPLSPHPRGQWQKKIKGKIHYFGRWGKIEKGKLVRVPGDGWQEALALYKAQADDLHAGKVPKAKLVNGEVVKQSESSELIVKDMCNRFLTSKNRQLSEGSISKITFKEYRATAERLAKVLGKDHLVNDLSPDDFAILRADISKTWGRFDLVTRSREFGRFLSMPMRTTSLTDLFVSVRNSRSHHAESFGSTKRPTESEWFSMLRKSKRHLSTHRQS